jgi:hypothetical protein
MQIASWIRVWLSVGAIVIGGILLLVPKKS